MALSSGTRLGAFEILSPLGAGGMGEVYRARDKRLGRDVAIKVIRPEVAEDRDSLSRFRREARLLAALSHPNVAALHGLEEEDGIHFLVMELVPGETLAQRLTTGPLPVREALGVARQVAEAVEAAHEQDIMHRDLKPANIKVTPRGLVKVLDFGLAKSTRADGDPGKSTQSDAATHEGTVLGTPAYMSPEQVRGQPLDGRTDVWSFGCVLYEALTGRRPFAGRARADLFAAILTAEPAWWALPPATPDRVRTLLQRCLEKDPKRRLADLGAARTELEAAVAELTAPATTTAVAEVEAIPEVVPVGRPRRRRWLLAVLLLGVPLLGLLLLVSGAIVGVVYLLSGPGRAVDSLAVLPFGDEAEFGFSMRQLITQQLWMESASIRRNREQSVLQTGQSAQQAGRELGVKAVLIGKVERDRQPMRVTAELIEVATGAVLWRGEYDCPAGMDAMRFKDGVAADVAQKLRGVRVK